MNELISPIHRRPDMLTSPLNSPPNLLDPMPALSAPHGETSPTRTPPKVQLFGTTGIDMALLELLIFIRKPHF